MNEVDGGGFLVLVDRIANLPFPGAVVVDVVAARYGVPVADVGVVAEGPLLTPHFARMQAAMAEVLEIKEEQINLKATRAEGLGSLGRGEGIMAQALVSLTT